MTRLRIILSAFLLLSACASAGPARGGSAWVVQTREIGAASGAPKVTRVTDLGPPVPLPEGALSTARSDGKFTIGEYVLVEGDDFGKLPTVLIGGRPARVLARIAGGGIVTQVPAAVTGGATQVEVSHPAGRHSVSIDVARYAVVVRPLPGGLSFLTVEGKGTQPAGGVELPGARSVRFSIDGAWAYVPSAVSQHLVVSTIAMAAPGGPAIVHTTKTRTAAPVDVALAGKRLAVVGAHSFQLFALDEPETTAPYDAVELPAELGGTQVLAADLSSDGQRLALLLTSNNLLIYSLAVPEAPDVVATVPLLPGKRLPLVRDLRFDARGTLWIVAGDSQKSLTVGHNPTQLLRLEAGASAPTVVGIAGAGPPLAIMPAPRESLKSATAIGDTAGDLPIFVSSLDQKLVQAADGTPATVVAALAEPGQVVRTDAAGRGGPLPALPATVAGAIALTPDATLLLATAWSFADGKVRFGLWQSGVGADATPRFVDLAEAVSPPGYLPDQVGDLAVQP